MTDIEAAWLAGLLEGEGCFSYKHTSKVVLEMTDFDIVDRVAKLLDSHVAIKSKKKENRKEVYRVSIHGDKARAVMARILPLMGERRTAKIMSVFEDYENRPGQAYGERCGSSKLSDSDATEIRNIYVKGSRKKGERSSDLAKKYGVSQSAIWFCVNRRQA